MRAALCLEVLRSMRRGYFDSVVRVNGLTVTVRYEPLVMPSITVEPFTSAVLVANVAMSRRVPRPHKGAD
jgi:hypothetical protein